VICMLEQFAAMGLLTHETEPRPAAEVIELQTFASGRPRNDLFGRFQCLEA
jgi:hypothetical protein